MFPLRLGLMWKQARNSHKRLIHNYSMGFVFEHSWSPKYVHGYIQFSICLIQCQIKLINKFNVNSSKWMKIKWKQMIFFAYQNVQSLTWNPCVLNLRYYAFQCYTQMIKLHSFSSFHFNHRLAPGYYSPGLSIHQMKPYLNIIF